MSGERATLYIRLPGSRGVKRSTGYALLSLFLVASYLRLLPVTRFLYWGADFGEYFLVTRLLAEGAPLPRPYAGWGVTYPEFPGMNVLVAAVSWTGVDLAAAAVLVVPVLAALTVVPVFLLGREVTGRDGVGLLAAAIVAVAMPHVYPTSHPIPGALGDLLFVTGLLLLLRLPRDPRTWGLLALVALALVPVHHLTSYFLLLSVFLVAVLRVLLGGASARAIRSEVALLALLVAVNVAYWTLFADSFRDFLGVGRFPWWVTATLLLLLPLALLPLAALRRGIRRTYRPSFPLPGRGPWILAVTSLTAAALLAVLTVTVVPGTTIPVPPVALLSAAPYVGLFLLAAPGRRFFDFLPGGLVVTGAFVALNLSWIVGSWVAPTFLIPYRHLEYLTPLLGVLAGLGAIRLGRTGRGRRVLVPVLAGLLLAAAATAVPPREAVGNHFEGVRAEALDGVHWSGLHVEGIVATDHRASSVLFGLVGVPGTWDAVASPLLAPSFPAARAEMLDHEGGRIDYVLLDRDLVAGATLLPWDPGHPLSPEARAKFLEAPYVKLYDDGYTQVYWVNWGLG